MEGRTEFGGRRVGEGKEEVGKEGKMGIKRGEEEGKNGCAKE